LKPISPSALETFRDCTRKWGFVYLDGRKTPPSPSAELGTRVHKTLEAYFALGLHPDYRSDVGAIAESGLPLWPAAGSREFKLEQHVTTTVAGLAFHGYQDLEYVDDDGVPVVADHKTTSNAKWALTPESLRTNTQALVYAQAALERHGTPAVRLRWGYMLTGRTRKAWAVSVTVTRAEVLANLEANVVPVARLLKETRENPPSEGAIGLPPNIEACSKYGGCPFRSDCNLSPLEVLKSAMSNDFLSRLQAQKAATAAATATADAVPAEAPAEPDAHAAPINPPARPTLGGGLLAKLGGAATAPAQPALPAPPPTPAGASKGGLLGLLAAAKAAPAPTPAAPAPTPAAPAPTPDTTAPLGGTPVAAQTPAPAAPKPSTPKATKPAPVTSPSGFVLLIDCAPWGRTDREVTSAATLAREVARELCAKLDVPDFSAVEYGKGPGLLRALFDELYSERALGGFVVADSRDPGTAAILPVLEAWASSTIRGVR